MANQGSSTASSPSRAPNEPPTIFSIPPTQKDAVDLQQNQALSGKLSLHFTQSQLTLALAIQRSKPPGSSADEYYTRLQKHRRHGKLESNSNRRYIDTTEFWKDQFDKVYQEKKELERKLYRLEERQRQQDSRHSNDQEHEALIVNARKRPADGGEFDGNREGQHKNTAAVDQDILVTLSSYIVRISRQCEILKKLMQNCNLPTDVESLSTSCIQSAAILEEALSECLIPLRLLKCNADRQTLCLVEQLLGQLARCFEACFDGLDVICETIMGRKNRFGVVDRMVSFFGMALDYLHTLCSFQADNEIEISRQQGCRRGMDGQLLDKQTPEQSSKRARTNEEEIKGTDNEEYAINKQLTRALESMTHMQWQIGQPGHKDLLEGILFFILEHIGRLVSHAVFDEHVATSDQLANITKPSPKLSSKASKLETRYMIKILAAALGGTGARKDLVSHILAEEISGTNMYISSRKPSGHSTEMLAKARKKIQCSLLKSVLGDGVAEGTTISKPYFPEVEATSLPAMDENGEKYGMDWLLGSVWALIGWDMISP